MSQTTTIYPVPDALTAAFVIAASTVTAIAIAAWLVHRIARRAIDKVPPEEVAPVILALAALLSSLRVFLPWAALSAPLHLPVGPRREPQTSLHNESGPVAPREAQHGE